MSRRWYVARPLTCALLIDILLNDLNHLKIARSALEPPEYERVIVIIRLEQVRAPDRPFKNPNLRADAPAS